MSIILKRIEEMHKNAVRSETPPFPRTLMLDPCGSCNLRCVFCDNSKSGRKPAMMSLSLAERILSDAFAAGSRDVGFYLLGEPLLNVNLHHMVKTAEQIGYEYIYITTNGVLATPERVEMLVKSGLHSLKFSINAGGREEYRRIHGVDEFDTVTKNLRACIAMRSRMEEPSLQRLMISSKYEGEPDAAMLSFHQEYSSLVDEHLLSPAMVGIHENLRMRYGHHCLFPFERVHVTAEGFLTVCCNDQRNLLVVGDLNREKITDAWFGEYFRNFRKRFLREDLDGTLCGRCQYGCSLPVLPLSNFG